MQWWNVWNDHMNCAFAIHVQQWTSTTAFLFGLDLDSDALPHSVSSVSSVFVSEWVHRNVNNSSCFSLQVQHRRWQEKSTHFCRKSFYWQIFRRCESNVREKKRILSANSERKEKNVHSIRRQLNIQTFILKWSVNSFDELFSFSVIWISNCENQRQVKL